MQYLLPGSVVMSIFMMVMIGGGIIFIDDKARGLHEGYLVTPITKLELIAGFNISGTVKAVLAGMFLLIIGSFIAGIPNPLDPMRLILTPHNIGANPGSGEAGQKMAAQSMLAILDGRIPDTIVNPLAIPRWKERFGS